MFSASLRDIKKLSEWAHLEETEIIHPKYDEQLSLIYYALGMDTRHPFTYHANNHRDAAGNVGIGCRVVGELREDREYINSGMCSTFDRMVMAGRHDTSLMLELCELSGKVLDFKSFFTENEVDESEREVWPSWLTEGDYEPALQAINDLNETIKAVRGLNIN